METNRENAKYLWKISVQTDRNTKEKKAEQVRLARKLGANVRVTNFRVLFAAYRARVQGPLSLIKSRRNQAKTAETKSRKKTKKYLTFLRKIKTHTGRWLLQKLESG